MSKSNLNLFATVLTHAAPSSNYRGESEENRTIIQKISRGGSEYAVVSPESMRNALREILAAWALPVNRTRLHDEDQLAVEYKDFPNPETFADDFLFGYMVADAKQMPKGRPAKRDSILRMNMAVALVPYRFDATFHQSPLNAGESPWKNASSSMLLHREVSYTAFQYPFALAFGDCCHNKTTREWTKTLIRAIGELSNVAGGHARSLYEMAPRSVVARLTPSLVGGFDSYGFDEKGEFPEIGRIKASDLTPGEFWLGGDVVRQMPEARREDLRKAGAHLDENPQRLLAALAVEGLGG